MPKRRSTFVREVQRIERREPWSRKRAKREAKAANDEASDGEQAQSSEAETSDEEQAQPSEEEKQ